MPSMSQHEHDEPSVPGAWRLTLTQGWGHRYFGQYLIAPVRVRTERRG